MHDRSMSERRITRRRRAVSAIAVAALSLGVVGAFGAASAQAATPRVTFSGAVPSWAVSANSTAAAASSAVVEGEIFLKLQDPDGAAALAAAVSDPTSATYRQYLSPADWIARFAPTQDTYDSQLAALKNGHMTITGQPASRQYIVYRGTVANMNALFSTRLATYDVEGQALVAPSSAPSMPASLAAQVSGISLDQGRLLTRPRTATQSPTSTPGLTNLSTLINTPKAVIVKTACSTYTGQNTVTMPLAYGGRRFSTANCGYTPKQLRAAYGVSASSGAGQTVAIVGTYDSPTMLRDANTFSALRGEPQFASGQYTDVSPSRSTFTDQAACGWASGWQVEQTLDVESLHAIAPQASVVYSGASNCGGGIDIALSRVLDQGLATMVSNSYGSAGEPGATGADYVAGEVNLQLQAAGEGIGLYFASGDDGDERANIGHTAADFPASSPWVTAVGGTAIGISKSNSRVFTTGWGDSLDQVIVGPSKVAKYRYTLPGVFSGGAGGGISRLFSAPGYQSSLVGASLSKGKRAVPDVAALADPYTGFGIAYHPITNNGTYATGSWQGGVAGGTSLAAPIYVGLMAAVQQSTGARIGFSNPISYALAGSSASPFTDVVNRSTPYASAYSSGSATYLVTHSADSSLKAVKGYDSVTGLGEIAVAKAQGFADPIAPTATTPAG